MSKRFQIVAAVAAVLLLTRVAAAEPAGSAFGYQAQIKQGGVPVNDECEFDFSLWRDAASTLPNDQIGPTLSFDGLGGNPAPIIVVGGLFHVQLDFGATAFTDEARWLEVTVRCPVGVGDFETLVPRERIAGSPYAIHTRGITVDEIGQVGIGTPVPYEMLEVAGNIMLRVEGFDPYIQLVSDDAADATTIRIKSLDGVGFAVTNSQDTPLMVVSDGGKVGIGTTNPRASLEVSGTGTFMGNHIAIFDSHGGASPDGIAIRLGTQHTNKENNFITFLNGADQVTGRIEGFDLENGDWIVPPPLPSVSLSFDPAVSYNPAWFDPGTLPTAAFERGALPRATFEPGELQVPTFHPGRLPNLTFDGGSLPSASLNRGTMPTLTFNDGDLPEFTATYCGSFLCGFSWDDGSSPTASLSAGVRPFLSFSPGSFPSASLYPGTLPSFSLTRGALSSLTFTQGLLPNLTFSGGSLPQVLSSPIVFGSPSLTFDLPTIQDLDALFCWAYETGTSDYLTLDPVSLAVTDLRQTVMARCKDEGVTYGSKGADYAEWLPKLNPEDRFQFGQIVGVHGGKISLKTEGADQIMATSRAPVVVGNVPPDDEKQKYTTVGFMGQLPVVVRGKVRTGDYIIPSGLEDGTAVAVTPENLTLEHLGRTLGRAWSDSDNDVYSLINVVIGLNGNETKIILEKQREWNAEQMGMQLELAAENARLRTEMVTMGQKLSKLMTAVESLQDQAMGRPACPQAVATASASR